MIPYDTVIFDLDGTLTKSEEGIYKSIAYALEKMDMYEEDTEVPALVIGPPLYHSFTKHYGMSSLDAQTAITHYRERYGKHGIFENSVYAGIRYLLSSLKKQGVYLGIATGKPQRPTEKILDYFGMAHFFDKIVGIDDKDTNAPKAELIKQALPDEFSKAIMVGDRVFDIKGAKDNKIASAGVSYGYGGKAELEKAGADFICESVKELRRLLVPEDMEEKPGFFISMEGGDGSGKSTQTKLLRKKLLTWGFDPVDTREPGGTFIGEKIRELLLDIDNMGMSHRCEALMYAAARAQHVEEVIEPVLRKGKLVLCDRYVDSSIAYQGGGRELGVNEVRAINAFAIGDTLPDLTIFLELDQRESLKRKALGASLDRIEVEQANFHEKVQKAYENIIQDNRDRFLIFDGNDKPDKISEEIFKSVLERLLDWERR